MPSVSAKQHRFMAAVAHNPAFAKKAGVPQSVGKDFSNADKGKTFKKGGDTMATKMDPKMMAMMMAKKRGAMAPAAPAAAPASGGMMGMKKGGGVKGSAMGSVKTAAPSRDGIATKGKTKGTMIKMSKGGKAC